MDFQRYAGSLRARLHGGEVNRAAVIGVAAMLVAALAAVSMHACGALGEPAFEVERAQASVEEVAAPEPAQVAVYVSGCVAAPGLYYLDEGQRVADAIEAAGGFAEGAAQGQLNLARVIADGEQVDVPSEEALAAAAAAMPATSSGAAAPAASGGRVNINTADATALQTLDGIGQATAAKIVADREANGPFKTVDDLTRVSGIGDKKLANIRDSICV